MPKFVSNLPGMPGYEPKTMKRYFAQPLMINEDIVRAAYKFMLRREPDSQASVEKAGALKGVGRVYQQTYVDIYGRTSYVKQYNPATRSMRFK